MSDWAGIAWLVVLLIANAFFVGAEFAVISARRSQIEPLAEKGSRSARTALYAMEHATLMLATLRPPEGDIADLSNLACGLAQTLAFDRAGRIAGGLFGPGGSTVVTIGSLADGTSSVATGSGLIC